MKPIELNEITESQIILEQGDDGIRRARFLVSTANAKNRNGRIYTRELLAREGATPMRGDILGQDGHPMSSRKFTEQFLIWEKVILDGDKQYAVAKVVPTKPFGENFLMLAEAGAMVSCSRVGVGSIKEGTVNGVKGMVVQDDYQLKHIDVIVAHEQSDPNALLTRFEAYDPNTEKTMELTLEQLREENGELVTQIEDAATQPLKEQVTQLEGQVETLTAEKDAAVKLAEETQTKLTDIETKLAEIQELVKAKDEAIAAANSDFDVANQKVDGLTEQVSVLTEAEKARNHLLEKVKGERAAWLILDELKTELTVADVDAKFDEAKRKCDALIEHAAQPAGKTVYNGNENSEIETANQEKDKPKSYELSDKTKRLGRSFGVAVN